MKELQNISCRYAEARRTGRSAALATVVGVNGSSYRRPGARMLITEDGQLTGCVSGGCLERDVVAHARRALLTGESRVITYDSASDGELDEGFGLGCNGIVQVLIEPLDPEVPDHLAYISACLRHRQEVVIATVVEVQGPLHVRIAQRLMLQRGEEIVSDIEDRHMRDAILMDASRMIEGRSAMMTYDLADGSATVFMERIEPPLSLVIFGVGHDAVPLVRLARDLGWYVTLVDHRPANLARAKSLGPDAVVAAKASEITRRVSLTMHTATVVMNHNYLDDRDVLRIVVASPVRYVGVLGPRQRTERLLDDLRGRGEAPTPDQVDRLYGPIGLDIGADNPEEIALAIVAEIQAVFAKRSGGPARDRTDPLHSRSEQLPAPLLHPGITCEVGCAATE